MQVNDQKISRKRGTGEDPLFPENMGLSEINSKNYKIILNKVKYASPTSVSDSPKLMTPANAYNIKTEIKQQQKHLSNEELELIAQKYLAGISTYDLAQEFGCHRYTISNNLGVV